MQHVDYRRIPNILPNVRDLIEKFYQRWPDLRPCSFDENAEYILSKRYLLRDEAGNIAETSQSLLVRVACGVVAHRVEHVLPDTTLVVREYPEGPSNLESVLGDALEYYNLMADLEFLPNSPTLMNAGTKMGQLSACFVVPVEDSMTSIMDAVKSVALIHQSGGGTGMDFSKLRPAGAFINSTGGEASGPVSFMRVFDATTQEIKQGGKRRGANMGMLRIDHPDIREFITCKDKDGQLNNFNISVAVTDEFMRSLERWENAESLGLEKSQVFSAVRDPKSGAVCGEDNPKELWNLLVEHAHKTGDPGVVFIDTINAKNPFEIEKHPQHRMECTNPCGEQPLEAYEACNLGSINLNQFLLWDTHTNEAVFQSASFERAVGTAVRFLNDVVDSNRFPLKEIDDKVRANRKIGLGVMGLADVLIELGCRYGSSEAICITRNIMSKFEDAAYQASIGLAGDQGKCFDTFSHLRGNVQPRRNATLTTIAPTGTIGMLANASGGIEPVFALAYTKTVMDGKQFKYVHQFIEKLRTNNRITDEEYEAIKETGQPPASVLERFSYLATAYSVTPEEHLLTQAAVQDHTDNAVSKTINLPNDATTEDIDYIYRLAYRTGCKGVTVYRDGSKYGQVLTTGSSADGEAGEVIVPEQIEVHDAVADCSMCPYMQEPAPAHRPKVMLGMTVKEATGCGSFYITINQDEDGNPVEVFTRLGKGGNCAGASAEVVGRLVSNMLRAGIPLERVIKQMLHVSCGRPAGFGPGGNKSCYDAMAKALQKYQTGEYHTDVLQAVEAVEPEPEAVVESVQIPETVYVPANGACPECGGSLLQMEGCLSCPGCGYSKCS